MNDVSFKDFKNPDEIEVKKEKKTFEELPTFFISAAFIAIALVLLPVFTALNTVKKNSGYNGGHIFLIVMIMMLYLAMFITEILVPLRFYIRHLKERKYFTGLARTVVGVCIFTLFVIVFMVFLGILLIL